MKTLVPCLLTGLLLASCGKEEVKPAAGPKQAAVAKPEPEKKAPIVAPQGKLPKMDPEKAKFIAVPSTPKDAEVKKAEVKKVETPEVKKAEVKEPEIKKAVPQPASTTSEAAPANAATKTAPGP